MKKILLIIVVIATGLFSLVSCGNDNPKKDKISALTYCNEYDFSYINFSDLLTKAKDIFSSEEYLVQTNQENDTIYIMPSNSEDRSEKGYMFIEKYESIEKAHEVFISNMVGTSPLIYRSILIRINDIIFREYGGSIALKMLEDYLTDFPDERTVSEGLIQKVINKKIDFDKFEELIKRNKYTKYDDPLEYDYIINSDGISSIFWFNSNNTKENSEHIFNSLPTGSKGFLLAGTLIEYENCAFIFLDDFWLDIIKQCEK